MSSKQQMVWLTPPDYPSTEEHIESHGHKCEYCHGYGGFAGDEQRGIAWRECPVCKGAGMMDAIVTIKWRPSKKRL